MPRTKKTPDKIVWLKANQLSHSKLSVGVGRKRLFIDVELFGDARDRLARQIERWLPKRPARKQPRGKASATSTNTTTT